MKILDQNQITSQDLAEFSSQIMAADQIIQDGLPPSEKKRGRPTRELSFDDIHHVKHSSFADKSDYRQLHCHANWIISFGRFDHFQFCGVVNLYICDGFQNGSTFYFNCSINFPLYPKIKILSIFSDQMTTDGYLDRCQFISLRRFFLEAG